MTGQVRRPADRLKFLPLPIESQGLQIKEILGERNGG